jgi:nucleoside recognition membrane protein YjiH
MPTVSFVATASQQSLARLEREKTYLLNQLQKVRGDIRKEQEIILQNQYKQPIESC